MSEYWKNELYLEKSQITLCGDSRAKSHTSFYIEEWNIMLSAGINPHIVPEAVFIPSTKWEYIKNLYSIILMASEKNKDITVVVPKGSKPFIMNWLNYTHKMTNLNYYKGIECDIKNMSDGDSFEFVSGGTALRVVSFATNKAHSTMGYAFEKIITRLKSRYKKKTIFDMIRYKCPTHDKKYKKKLIYVGPSTKTIFSKPFGGISIKWSLYQVILLECTYVEKLSKFNVFEAAENEQTGYFDAVIEFVKKNKKTDFILTHWCNGYDSNDVLNIFNDNWTKNSIPWLVPLLRCPNE